MPEFTGERVVPGEVDRDLFNEHLSRYAFARRYAEHRRVLDLGCGTGFGAALLAEVAEQVTGVDVSLDAVEFARNHYQAPNLTFEQADAAAASTRRFDVITAFEVIEHLEDWRGLVRASREQLSHGGLLFVSTPNRPFYAEARGESGGNPFHVHEFDHAEFREALTEAFPHVTVLVQNHSSGILFASVKGAPGIETAIEDTRIEVDRAHFFLAICSVEPLVEVDSFFWIPSSANLLEERDRHIALLRGEVAQKSLWWEHGRAELAARNGEYEKLLGLYREMQGELESRNRWALEQAQQLRERDERVLELQAEVEETNAGFARTAAAYEERLTELEAETRARTEWALNIERRLTTEFEERGRQLAQCVELLDAAERTVGERTLWAQGLDRELREWQERFTAMRRAPWVRAGNRLGLVADRAADRK